MDRTELGAKLLEWHKGQTDPVYAVGSFYISGDVYPTVAIVNDAIWNLTRAMREFEAMAKGEAVMVRRNGAQVDLAKFAGYSVEECAERAAELDQLIAELEICVDEDYLSAPNSPSEE